MDETTDTVMSESVGKLAEALAAAQLLMGDAAKDATNPHFKNKYATLASVRAAVTEPLAKNGISVAQLTEPHGKEGVCVVTLMMHKSGEWLRSKLFVPSNKPDAQGMGSALSYARRYALAAICNIATDDDDDGNQAAKPSLPKPAAPAEGRPQPGIVESFLKRIQEAEDDATLSAIGGDVSKSTLSDKERDEVRKAYVAKAQKVGK